MPDKPNFLFFITDQHRADWLGCTGHPVVKTPNIDALAAKGQLIDTACVAAPVCMPNRASLMTGRMPSVHGLRTNGCRLPLGAKTFVDVLAAAGYDTALIGKSHLQPFTGLAPIGQKEDGPRLIDEAWRPTRAIMAAKRPTATPVSSPTISRRPIMGFSMWMW